MFFALILCGLAHWMPFTDGQLALRMREKQPLMFAPAAADVTYRDDGPGGRSDGAAEDSLQARLETDIRNLGYYPEISAYHLNRYQDLLDAGDRTRSSSGNSLASAVGSSYGDDLSERKHDAQVLHGIKRECWAF